MTRKDYIRLANALKQAKVSARNSSSDRTEDRVDGIDYAVGYIAQALQEDNSRFDAKKFLAAVGG